MPSEVAECRCRRGALVGRSLWVHLRGEQRIPGGRSSNDASSAPRRPKMEGVWAHLTRLELTDLLLRAVSLFGRLVDSVPRPVLWGW